MSDSKAYPNTRSSTRRDQETQTTNPETHDHREDSWDDVDAEFTLNNNNDEFEFEDIQDDFFEGTYPASEPDTDEQSALLEYRIALQSLNHSAAAKCQHPWTYVHFTDVLYGDMTQSPDEYMQAFINDENDRFARYISAESEVGSPESFNVLAHANQQSIDSGLISGFPPPTHLWPGQETLPGIGWEYDSDPWEFVPPPPPTNDSAPPRSRYGIAFPLERDQTTGTFPSDCDGHIRSPPTPSSPVYGSDRVLFKGRMYLVFPVSGFMYPWIL